MADICFDKCKCGLVTVSNATEVAKLKIENERMRKQLVKIFATGPIHRNSIGGPGATYKKLYLAHLIMARRGLGVPALNNGSHYVAWDWLVENGIAVGDEWKDKK